MKRSFLFTVLLLWVGAVSVQAEDKTILINGLWYFLDTDQQLAAVTKAPHYPNVTINGPELKGKVTVPEIVYDEDVLSSGRTPCLVVEIAAEAFRNCDKVTEVELPQSIIYIDTHAFSGCRKLKKINLPPNLKLIEQQAFFCCESLNSIVIPDSLKNIGSWAFGGCNKLKSVVWNADSCELLSYKEYSINKPDEMPGFVPPFADCPKLANFLFGDRVECIPMLLLAENKKVKEIVIPKSVREIGDHAFAYCAKLRKVRFESSLGANTNRKNWFKGTSASIESVLMPGESVEIY